MTPVRRVIAAACCVYFAFAATFWAVGAAAQDQDLVQNELFGIAPHPDTVDGTLRATSFVVPLEPGAIFEDAVRIFNKSGQTLELAIYAADAEAGQEDTISVGFRNSRPKGVGTWIDLSRDDVTLPARQELVVTFRVEVKNADPSPNLGAIVVESTGSGLSGNGQKLHLVVRTDAPNTETTSTRVRPLVLRSPWIIIAVAGLVLAAALVWIGARRARHPKDVVVPPGELEPAEPDADVAPEASRPVLKRLGKSEQSSRGQTAVLERSSTRSRDDRDERPLLDDALLVEVDPIDDEDEDDEDEIVWIDAEDDLENEDEEEEEDDFEDEPLPPARHRETAPPPKREPARVNSERRTSTSTAQRTTTSTAKNNSRKNSARTSSARKNNVRKPAAKKKPARTAAAKKPAPRKAAARKPAKSAAAKASNAKKNFIPLDDL